MTTAMLTQLEGKWRSGDHAGAQALAEAQLARGFAHPLVYRIAAEARMEARRFAEAGALLNQALAYNPAEPEALTTLAMLLHREGRPDEAVTVFGQVLHDHRTHARAWLGLATSLAVLEAEDAALESFGHAAAAAPTDAAPLGGLAELHFRAGRSDEALQAAQKGLEIDPDHPLCNWVLGRLTLSQGQADTVRTRMERLLVRGRMDPAERQMALHLLGDAFDRLERIPEAFNAYTRMNALVIEQNRDRFGPGGPVEDHLGFINRLGHGYASMPQAWKSSPAEVAPSPVRRHIFVMGYPRSGTTLASSVLGALPDVTVLEERRTLMDADFAFLKDDASLARLARLDVAEAEEQRQLYWTRVRDEDPNVDGKVLVDMAPLNSVKLPMLRKLFPGARFVICRRDPRDVVLSCFRQNFRLNASTYQMTTLEGAARHHAAAMAVLEANLGMTRLNYFELNYENFVSDFEQHAQAMFAGCGLEWDPQVLDFATAARQRTLRTASAQQVRSGLFDGSGQWRRYADQLKPVMPILAPFIRD
jgi:tetratricopeptide (TPR) repeat protein